MTPAPSSRRGSLAIVLHTHMPYVLDFGTWPFGEEWLWEAVATSYLPLLEVLDAAAAVSADGRAPVTVSITPVLADQLEAPGTLARCAEFLRTIRPESHARDIVTAQAAGDEREAAALARSEADYIWAAERLEALAAGDGLRAAFGAHATWTSAATHPILPLLALDESIELQLRVGIESHRRRFCAPLAQTWGGGFWLPECAYAPWLNPYLLEHGVTHTCVELTDALGLGTPANLRPIACDDGLLLVPIDRATVDLVWGADGYPSRDAYRDHHRLTDHHHRAHANDGSAYDQARAAAQARADAAEFVEAVSGRLLGAGGGLCVCALDTELLGHWWYEGPIWLREVLEQAGGAGLELTALSHAAIDAHEPAAATAVSTATTSWGLGNDLRTWSGPDVAELAFAARTAELETFAVANPPPRALRELLALQSSDWAFMVSRRWAGEYPKQRASGHAAQLRNALAGEPLPPTLGNLAPDL